jgi:hypothetical protein
MKNRFNNKLQLNLKLFVMNLIALYEDIKYIGDMIGFSELGKLTLQSASPNKKHKLKVY